MKKILIFSTIFIIIITISTIGYSIVSANITVEEIEDIITYQYEKEKYITPYGYTLDNPNIILNPYDISPLTAIILFETKENLPVTITVKGKDQNSTYTNTFESTNRHYIPVYGLYANTINNITIKCGNKTKEIAIETEALPFELILTETVTNTTNDLTFITSDTYPYAIDNNNEVRWYLTKNYSSKIDYLDNGHLLLSDEPTTSIGDSYGLVEIDLLGKIYKQYNLDTAYLGTYEETDTSLIIKTTEFIEIDKQTGEMVNKNNKRSSYQLLSDTNKQLLPLYNTKKNYKLTTGIKYNLTKETKQSNEDVFLVGYVEPDKNYKEYDIKINTTTNNLQINGNFTEDDEVYLILDKFLDKRIYDITDKHTIINKEGLSGKYSIYLKINDTIYKTNNYINN